MLGSGGGKPIRRPDTAPCSGTGASLAANSTPVGGNSINSNNVHSSGVSPQVQRQRASQRGHIQLQILSAERLMPARKVGGIYLKFPYQSCFVIYTKICFFFV